MRIPKEFILVDGKEFGKTLICVNNISSAYAVENDQCPEENITIIERLKGGAVPTPTSPEEIYDLIYNSEQE